MRITSRFSCTRSATFNDEGGRYGGRICEVLIGGAEKTIPHEDGLCADYLHDLSERFVSTGKKDRAISLLEFVVESRNGTRDAFF